MTLFICQYCSSVRKSKKSLIGHETFCKKNPEHKIQNTDFARQKANQKISCIWCEKKYTTGNIKKHENTCLKNPRVIELKTKTCPVCNKNFLGDSTTCSHSCSNVFFRHGKSGGYQYKTDKQLDNSKRYRDICFRYHEKKCIICNEKNIVAVHHLNENRKDNRPENLIPICPTHHQYYHSKYRNMVEKQILEYINNWKEKLSVG